MLGQTHRPHIIMAPTATNAERLASLEAQLDNLLTRQTNLQNENDTLRERVASLPSMPDVPDNRQSTPMSSTSNGHGRSEPKVASPEYFNGQRNKVTTFVTQVTMVITLQPTRFLSEEAKVIYAGSFLRDTAFLWFQPYVTAEIKPGFMTNFTEFTKELQRTFGDPDEVATAERQLYALKQKSSVSAYLADFTRYAVLVKWNDAAKAAQFYRGLKEPIKDELARTGKPEQLKDLQEAAIRIDTRLFERQVERGDRDRSSSHPINFNTARTDARSFIRPFTTTNSRTETTYTRQPGESLRAMFQPKKLTTRRGKLTPAEYQRRKDNNLCLYCAEKGHSVKECPIAPKGRSINRSGNA